MVLFFGDRVILTFGNWSWPVRVEVTNRIAICRRSTSLDPIYLF
jgi:hypothetical protein